MRNAGRKAALWMLLPTVIGTACNDGNIALAQTNGTRQQVREQLGPVPSKLDTAAAARLASAFRGAADRALPAVVQIRVVSNAPRQQVVRRSFPFNIPGFPDSDPQAPERGTGSGVIFDKTGYILTNNHVVGGADQVTVTLPDGRVFDARVVGTDPETDVGVIRINPGNHELPVATLGSSDALNIGDWVLALGNPLGLEFTVTAGIVSAKSRQLGIVGRGSDADPRRSLEAFIQTDAAINPGNSGGPLVDLMGRVVGINTAIQSPTGYYSGAGFAIPIEIARKVAGDLIEFGVVHRPRLGVTVAPVDEADAEVYKLPEIAGAELSSVDPESPAGQAGLHRGDVIVSMDGEPIRSNVQLMAELARKRPGATVKLGYIRYGERGTANVKLGQFEVERPQPTHAAPRVSGLDLLGFRVSVLTPELARQFRLDPRAARNQVIISELTGIQAQDAGLPPVAEIVSINGEEVDSVADVERIANALRPGQVISLVYRPLVGDIGELIVNYRAPR